MKNIYRFISSMKAGLALMGVIGLISAVGSVFLPQSFFKTNVFKLLLLSLLINMALCTVNQLSGYVKRRSVRKKSSYRQAALIILHAGIVFILVGAAVNLFYGAREQITILKGDAADLSLMDKSAIPFSLQLDEFEIEYNPDGSVSQYYSYVRLIEKNEAVKEAVISVNSPLEFKKVKIYLLDYDYDDDLRPHVQFIVKTDPGLPLAFLGGLMLTVGVCLSFNKGRRL